MKHSVRFDNCENHWDNALPFGNGVFGCMLFYERNRLYMPMNHYEVYYNISDTVLPEDILRATPECTEPGELHRQTRQRADRNTPPEGEPHCLYRRDRAQVFDRKKYGIAELSNTYPQTGELIFGFSPKLREAKSNLALYVEDAKGVLTLEEENAALRLETLVSRKDCIISSLEQSEAGLLNSVTVFFPGYRETNKHALAYNPLAPEAGESTAREDIFAPKITYRQVCEDTVLYTVKRALSKEKNFTFTGILHFAGAQVCVESIDGGSAVIKLLRSEKKVRIFTAVVTQWKAENTETAACSVIKQFAAAANQLLAEHKAYWKAFFDRSAITLPDPFLEKVYYINQYALDCCSGKDGIMKHHACGLNGLWAIRHPNIWGSMWYWDVNIQAAFAGVFSSNRLDLAKVFSDGLKTYEKLAQRAAHDVHGLTGCASDYPYNFYYSCWTWCAQYLWYLYEYSLDEEYLKNEAYPLFLKLCEFTLGIFEYDENTDTYTVYPDICPEQGPLAHNTTITVSCAKYLFKFTLEAAKILGDSSPILQQVERVLPKMPPYALSAQGKYGVHLKDSPDAPDNLWARHPSMLMPVFPIGEYGLASDEETRKIVSNTVDYLEENCEIGIFGGSMIAASAARIGKGNTALRLLYEHGIDHMLRSNGLSAEDTDRFMNFCLIGRQPLYYPCMMEFTGEMLAAVNEMLLQSHDGFIRVFPALPDGVRDYSRAVRNGDTITNYLEQYTDYDAWKNVRFDKLLAKGAFEVSASMKAGKLEWILVHSQKGGAVKVTSPFLEEKINVFCDGTAIPAHREKNVLAFETEEGKTYLLAADPAVSTAAPAEGERYDSGISVHRTFTRRDISIGEDREAQYHKKLDRFMRDWYLGNVRMSNRTVYKFDFTGSKEKNYAAFMPIQSYVNQGHPMDTLDFFRLGAWKFTPRIGFGFADPMGIAVRETEAPDALRADFAEGTEEVEFIIDAPRGQYEVLVISGDGEEDSVTIARCENSRRIGGSVVPAGQFQCEMIPVITEYDEPIRIRISTAAGYRWKLNAIMLNLVKAY